MNEGIVSLYAATCSLKHHILFSSDHVIIACSMCHYNVRLMVMNIDDLPDVLCVFLWCCSSSFSGRWALAVSCRAPLPTLPCSASRMQSCGSWRASRSVSRSASSVTGITPLLWPTWSALPRSLTRHRTSTPLPSWWVVTCSSCECRAHCEMGASLNEMTARPCVMTDGWGKKNHGKHVWNVLLQDHWPDILSHSAASVSRCFSPVLSFLLYCNICFILPSFGVFPLHLWHFDSIHCKLGALL